MTPATLSSHQRVGVFVDVQNMYYSGRAVHGKKVNFKNILKEAVGGRQLVRAFAYGITTEEAHEGDFHDALKDQGYEVKTKSLQTFADGQKKGDWDVGIAVDVMRLEPKIDVAVLVSGDGDYVPLVQFAQEKGLRVELMSFAASTSTALQEAADSFTDMSERQRTFLINDGKLLKRLAKKDSRGRRPTVGEPRPKRADRPVSGKKPSAARKPRSTSRRTGRTPKIIS